MIPHRPLVVQKIKYVEFIIHVLAVNAFHFSSISLWSVSYLNRTNTSFCLHCKHTPQHRTASGNTHFHFASSFIPFSPSLFPAQFRRYIFIFCDEFAPKTNILNNSPPPISCCSHFRQSCFITCACGKCIHSGSIALRELRSYLTPNPYTSLCLHSCIHLSTARHKYSFSHSIYSVPSVIPMQFSYAFPAVAFIPAACLPRKNLIL